MSLRLRLILGYSALLLLLALAAWLGVRALTRDLTGALGETAASVSRSVFTVLQRESRTERRIGEGDVAAPAEQPPAGHHVLMMRERIVADGAPPRDDVRVIVDGKELTPAQLAEHRARHPQVPIVELVRREGDDVPMLRLSSEGFEHAIPLPRAGVDAALARFTQRLGWGLLALLVAGLAIAVWIAQRVTQAASVRADRELAELGEIGRGLAHSLRNPLHALGLSLEALAAESNGTAAAALAQSGREQLQRVDQALRGFLALSAGNGAEASEVRVADVVDDVLLEASQRAQGRVQFERTGADPRLLAVPAELRVMLHALMINALEASPEGGCVRVELSDVDHGGVRIDVCDEGEGVPAALRERLFQPHVSGKPHGAGMGLYLAQRLARSRYRGHIALDATAPRGTRARLMLQARENARG